MDNGIRISSAAVSERGLSEKRPQNEDSFLEMGQSGIFAVADGVGGAQAGEVASQMAVEILGEAFANLSDNSDAETVMRTAITRANAAIHQMAHELPQLANMATTIVALHLAGNIVTIGHVGDSRLYSVDREGNLTRETEDHSMVAEEVRAGRMTEEQAENHPSRNIISRALGAEPTVEIDIKTIMVEPGTSFLICSDGITRHVGDQEIKGVLTFGGDPVDICEYLKGLCYERGAEDNLTAVVVKVSGTSATVSEAAPVFDLLDEDEPTIATARSPFETTVEDDKDEVELLELDTQKIALPDGHENAEAETESFDAPTESAFKIEHDAVIETEPEIDGILKTPPEPESMPMVAQDDKETSQSDTFSMFGDSGESDETEAKPGVLGKVASAIGLILIGGLLGLSIYHFAWGARTGEPSKPQLSEMKAENIAFSSFEKNRRNVDSDPSGFLKEMPPPDDAVDYYLRGRAYILIGDFPTAHTSLIEAQKRLATVDPVNAKILATDIAMALVITNDPTMPSRLKKELDNAITLPTANSNANAGSAIPISTQR